MLNRVKTIFFAVIAVLLLCSPSDGRSSRVLAAESLLPMADNNLSISLIRESSLTVTPDGYERVFYKSGKIYIEEYTDTFQITGKKVLDRELDLYGGFFSGEDANFFVFGKNNTAEDTSAEVVRVVKYDKDWNRVGAVSLTGDSAFAHEIRYPFDAGNVNMAECDGILYIVTGHEGYVDPDYNQGHQGFLMFAVNESSMTGRIADADLWHSFSQHITIANSSEIYVLEESEGSRQTQITRKTASNLNGTTIPVLEYGGDRTSAWAISTYATADAISFSEDNILAAGTSIDQSRYDDESYTKSYNIYLTVTPRNSFTAASTTLKWITQDNLTGGYKDVKLTKISDDRFLLSWERKASETSIAEETDFDSMSQHVLHFVLLDGQGNPVSEEYKKAAAISECEPVVKNGKVVYYASDGATLAFYQIDPENGHIDKTTFCSAGENASWSFADGVLTISGKGRLYDNFSNGLTLLRDKITKLVIGEDITEIGTSTFANLKNLQQIEFGGIKTIGSKAFSGCSSLAEVRIPKGVTSIGAQAFYGISNLKACYIPDSVSTIGDRAFHTGSYWTGSGKPVYRVTIYGTEGSAACTYAEENEISYKVVKLELKDTEKDYTGAPIPVDSEYAGFSSDPVITYYTNEACTEKTGSAQGALEQGGAPANAGTYYVKGTVAADDVYDEINSRTAALVIHKYIIEKTEDGIAYLKCEECGKTKAGRIPTSYSVWWWIGYQGYSYCKTMEVGQKVTCKIDSIKYQTEEGEALSDFVVELDDPEAADVTGSNLNRTFTWKKCGSFVVQIYPKYNESLKRKYTIKVVKAIEGVDLEAEPVSPQPYESAILFKAVPDGGKGTLTYQFSVTDAEGNIADSQSYSRKDTFQWTPKTVGTFRIRAEVKDAGDLDEESNPKVFLSDELVYTIEPAATVLADGQEILADAGLVYGQKISELVMSEAVLTNTAFENAVTGTKIPGKLTFADPEAVLTAGTHTVDWIFTPDSENYAAANGSCQVTVAKADPEIRTLPEAAAVTYHPDQTLAVLPITGGDVSVPGTWEWKDGTVVPSVNRKTYTAVFIPTDTENYNTAEAELSLEVKKAVPELSAISAAPITYGQSLADSELAAAAQIPAFGETEITENALSVSGTVTWIESGTKPAVTDSLTTNYAVRFTPDDTENYEMTETAAVLEVVKAKSRMADNTELLTDTRLVYGQSVQDLQWSDAVLKKTAFVNADTGETVPGTVKWDNEELPLTVGLHDLSWTFTPDDAQNIEGVTGTCEITVVKADPEIRALPELTGVSYHPDRTLSVTAIEGGDVSVPGTWEWKDGTVVPSVNRKTYTAVFIPTDTENYNTAEAELSLEVKKAVPELSAISAAPITYGQSLADSELTAAAQIPVFGGTEITDDSLAVSGIVAWEEPETEPVVADSLKTQYDICFVPDDADNYETVKETAVLVINKAKAPGAVPEGRFELPYSTGTVDPVILEDYPDWSFTDAVIGTEIPVEEDTVYEVKYTGKDAGNYETETSTVTLLRKECTHETTETRDAKEADCVEDGYSGDIYCTICGKLQREGEIIKALGHVPEILNERAPSCEEDGISRGSRCRRCGEILEKQETIPASGHAFGEWKYSDPDSHERICANDAAHVEREAHDWGTGIVSKAATTAEPGRMVYTCTICGGTKQEEIPMLKPENPEKEADEPESKPGKEAQNPDRSETNPDAKTDQPENQPVNEPDHPEKKPEETKPAAVISKVAPLNPEAAPTAKEAEKQITNLKDNGESKLSTFGLLQANAKKIGKNYITLKWTKVKGASAYTIYGNRCGKKYHYEKIAEVKASKKTYKVKKLANRKKLKKGTFYKFMIVATAKASDGTEKAIAASKSIHIITKGSKTKGNFKSVKLKSKSKLTLKVKKKSKIKAVQVKESRKLKVKQHRKLSYESSNPAVASVSKKGIIKAKRKGKAKIYVYAQNGKFKVVKVTVK